jgi:negative regulator of sigma E activity
MSEPIREQVSAFLDGELPGSETELLLKRLSRDAELRESFGRYALIGEAMRGAKTTHLTRSFAARVNGAIDGEPQVGMAVPQTGRGGQWWRPAAGAFVAAGVAVVAVFALQQRANTPTLTAQNGAAPSNATAPARVAQNLPAGQAVRAGVGRSSEAISYTVPASVGDAPAALPAARLTSYVFAHSQYPSLLGQRDVLTDLIVEDEEPVPASAAARAR